MAKFIKPFRGVPEGKIYPEQYAIGDDCPLELMPAAQELGAIESSEKLDLFSRLDAAQIKYDKRWSVEKLSSLLSDGRHR